MIDPGGDRDSLAWHFTLRQSHHRAPAKNLCSTLALQLNRKDKCHFNHSIRRKGICSAKKDTGVTDVFHHTFMPLLLAPNAKPHHCTDLVPLGPCNSVAMTAVGPFRKLLAIGSTYRFDFIISHRREVERT